MIKLTEDFTILEKFMYGAQEVSFDGLLFFFKESSTEAVWSWCFVVSNMKKCFFDHHVINRLTKYTTVFFCE